MSSEIEKGDKLVGMCKVDLDTSIREEKESVHILRFPDPKKERIVGEIRITTRFVPDRTPNNMNKSTTNGSKLPNTSVINPNVDVLDPSLNQPIPPAAGLRDSTN
jgi:hypothetical protein